TDMTPASLSILAALETPDGTGLSLLVEDVVVTYIRPGFGTDLPGFFVQAEQTGPALFVAVDPSTLSTAILVGDMITFTVEAMGTAGGLRFAAEITDDVSVASHNNSVAALLQNVNNAADLVSALDDYTSELVAADLTITSDFTGAGSGHMAAQVATTAIPSDTNLKLRLPTSILNTLELEQGCVVALAGTPLWRYLSTAQLSAWDVDDLSVTSCPDLRVVSATAASDTTVIVTFSRSLNSSTLNLSGAQFTISGLSVTGAAISGANEVTLTTSTQVGGTAYTVVAAGNLQDIYTNGIDPAANSASFSGFITPAVVLVNEVNFNIGSGCDLIELRVISGGSMDGFKLYNRTDLLVTFTGLNVPTNALILVHINGGSATCNPQSATNEVSGPAEQPNPGVTTNINTAYDWYSTISGQSATDGAVAIYTNLDVLLDGVLLTEELTGTAAAGSETGAANIVAAGGWTNLDGSVPVGGYIDDLFSANAVMDLNGTGTTAAGTSIQRTSNADNNHQGDWAVVASSWGLINAGQTDF
ncbi:hypothetical protein KJ975_13110, partial [Myxococcota bacterium]|nr:hypothetical protein [Myxococcota bacterium]